MSNILQSPREKLISNFKSKCGTDYEKIYLSKLSDQLLQKKLNCYVDSILLQIENSANFESNLKSTQYNNSICIFDDITLIKTYTIDHISKINNESQLGMSLFIDWGYLLTCIDRPIQKQLMIIL